MSETRVVVSHESGVAHVELAREEKRNGLDLAMFDALLAAGEQLRADPHVRAVVLSGRGKSFCAGLDWGAFMTMGAEAGTRLLARTDASPANLAQRACWIWQELDVPVIAAVRGAAMGGGLQLALAADLRYVAPDAQLSVMEVRYGLIPDMSATKTLALLVRPDIARELVWSGRTVGADEAVSIGLATKREDDPVAAAMSTAREIAKRSPHAIRSGKRLMRESAPIDTRAAFLLETELQLALLGSANQMEAVSAAMTKRDGHFADVER